MTESVGAFGLASAQACPIWLQRLRSAGLADAAGAHVSSLLLQLHTAIERMAAIMEFRCGTLPTCHGHAASCVLSSIIAAGAQGHKGSSRPYCRLRCIDRTPVGLRTLLLVYIVLILPLFFAPYYAFIRSQTVSFTFALFLAMVVRQHKLPALLTCACIAAVNRT